MSGIDISLDLLDRLVIDDEGVVLGRVDDLEVESSDAALAVTALLIGPGVWGQRFGHRLGRWIEGWARVVGTHTVRIPIGHVERLEPSVVLRTSASAYPGALRSERWLRRYLISRVPGGRHASE